ncbi:hypothetical protein [Streptomyces fradiae]|uniref:hypothetical protein n=1 Tax=Streptomyces fradiae TaxID=1906 RepID=UPI003511A326
MKKLKAAAVVLGSLAVAGAVAPAANAAESALPLAQVTDSVGGVGNVTKTLPLDGATTSGLGNLPVKSLPVLGGLPIGG